MGSPLLLVKPKPYDIFQLYHVVLDKALSLILFKNEDKVQQLMFYISKVLIDVEIRGAVYHEIEMKPRDKPPFTSNGVGFSIWSPCTIFFFFLGGVRQGPLIEFARPKCTKCWNKIFSNGIGVCFSFYNSKT